MKVTLVASLLVLSALPAGNARSPEASAPEPSALFQRLFSTAPGSRPVLKPAPDIAPQVGTHLVGDFVVTAKGGPGAVLRAAKGGSAARIIVELGNVEAFPAEGSQLTWNEADGYTVKRVRRAQDGTLNLFVSRDAGR